MIRFPSISITAPPLAAARDHARPESRPADRLSLGAEVRESASVDNTGFLAALKANFKKKKKLLEKPGMRDMLARRKDIKPSELAGHTRWTAPLLKMLADNPLLRPADLADVDNEQVEVLRERPELHPQELPRMDRHLQEVLRSMVGERGVQSYLGVLRSNLFELMKKRADTRPEQMVDMIRKVGRAESPEMLLKASETLLRRPDLKAEQMGKFAQNLQKRVLYDGEPQQSEAAFSEAMDALQQNGGLPVERLDEPMKGMRGAAAREAGPERRGRVFRKRVRALS